MTIDCEMRKREARINAAFQPLGIIERDPRDKPRDEEGVVIRKKADVDKEFATALSFLENGYSGSSSPNRSVARWGRQTLSNLTGKIVELGTLLKCVGTFVGIFKNKFAVFVCISIFWSDV